MQNTLEARQFWARTKKNQMKEYEARHIEDGHIMENSQYAEILLRQNYTGVIIDNEKFDDKKKHSHHKR